MTQYRDTQLEGTSAGKRRAFAVPAPMLTGRMPLLLAAAVCMLCLTLPRTAAAAAQSAGSTENSRELSRQVDPSDWRLSPEAELLYYYLVLADGIADNSQPVISLALQGLLKLDPSLEVYQDSATIMLARRDYDSARKTALAGLKKYPGDNVLTLLLSAAYSESGDLAKAVDLLEKHVTDNAADKEAMQELVRLYINMGAEEKAAALFSRLPKTDTSAEAELFRAGVLATVGRIAEARTILQDLLEKEPDLFEAWLELAYLHEQDKKPEEAIKAYGKAAEIMPDNPDLQYRIAALYIGLEKPDKALEALDSAEITPQICIQAALRFADGGYYAEAEQMLDRAGKNGGNPEQLALILSMLKQENAKDPLEGLPPLDAIKPSSDLYPSALQQKARIYIAAGDYAKACSVARDGRKQFPDQKELWGLEAYALVKQKKIGDAEGLLAQSLEKYPDDEELLFSLGSVQDEAGKKSEAMQTMERILLISPNNYQALNYVGYTLAEEDKDLNRALSLITAALERRPDADYIVDSLAWVQYRLGRFDEAWESIRRCISLGGDDATMWEHYGDIALALGKKDEAAEGYTESILRKPENIDEVRKKLAALKK